MACLLVAGRQALAAETIAASRRKVHTIINRQNWESVRPGLLQSVAEADFVAIDYEFSGLHHTRSDARFIGVGQAYSAHAESARKFIPVQLGICAARRDKATNSWHLTPSSIYLFPSREDTSSSVFSVSTVALDFLISNGFDANEWIPTAAVKKIKEIQI
jgi:poly(A)-specific ribonuclease